LVEDALWSTKTYKLLLRLQMSWWNV